MDQARWANITYHRFEIRKEAYSALPDMAVIGRAALEIRRNAQALNRTRLANVAGLVRNRLGSLPENSLERNAVLCALSAAMDAAIAADDRHHAPLGSPETSANTYAE